MAHGVGRQLGDGQEDQGRRAPVQAPGAESGIGGAAGVGDGQGDGRKPLLPAMEWVYIVTFRVHAPTVSAGGYLHQ
ncbi:hypothetical protein GCM10009575_060250 [Streptomyces rhizosphaericus]|uniref:Uncharacterized protein n=1 Tax=Streptomyces rhizosphaericus TaxID=114699 RepID=A0ABN1QIN0_9ACTN